jgi:hypothetical protein
MKIRDLQRILKRINPEIPIEVNNQPIRRIDRAFNEKQELRIVLYTYTKDQEKEIIQRTLKWNAWNAKVGIAEAEAEAKKSDSHVEEIGDAIKSTEDLIAGASDQKEAEDNG